ncbi:G1/S-specific cyclin-E1 [Coemansia javaensis]|uniref:G1/S-specific cyclin-E1 n=1 Tax=Coemansia javaensis TaxID=2761396 RepID=A0A9W8LF64_9FUNG|nr:G1/S-specific cyclin-E1 [Coemansia javaensis]
MARAVNKENVPGVALGPPAKGLAAAKDAAARIDTAKDDAAGRTKTRKRPIADVDADAGAGAEQLVGRAKAAIRRRCAEMGIRKYASLASMSATHAGTAGCKGAGAALRRPPGLEARTEPSSEATVVVLSSDEDEGEDEDDHGEEVRREEAGLESQLTIVAPSSPVRPAERTDSEAGNETVVDPECTVLDECAAADPKFAALNECAVVDPERTVLGECAAVDPKLAVLDEYAQEEEEEEEEEEDCGGLYDDELVCGECTPEAYAELSEWLCGIEERHGAGLEGGLARHPELSGRMRPILVDWLMEVAADYRMHRQTLHLAVQFLDRFLARTPLQVGPGMLQCYGTACLSIAMKAEEQRAPPLAELTDFSKDAFSRDQLRQAEVDVLVALDWHLAVPTVHEFLCLMFQRAALLHPDLFADPAAPRAARADPCPATTPRRFDARQFTAACDHADALLHFQGALRFRASVVAAACFYLGTAPRSLDGAAFARCTGLAFTAVWPAVLLAKRLRAALRPAAAGQLCAQPCCAPADRFAAHLRRIRPAELWAFQPHHAHMLAEFEAHLASR